MRKSLLILLIAMQLTACAMPDLINAATNQEAPTTWWKDAVFYEIFVRSFYDSNGDGIGDFNGIIQKLDYLKELGIDAIWLMPIHPSPSYHGYDVINYFNVNPQYGTLDDFTNLLEESHKRGLRIIIDLVINHTSSQNPWFIDANNNPESSFRDWYNWADTDPGYNGPLGDPWHKGNQGYYYGIFSHTMPDLNYKNPTVTEQMNKIVNFWLNDIGVDGFRVDAVKYMIEEGQKQENTVSTHNWLTNFFIRYKADNPEAFTVGEVWGAGAFAAKTYKDQLDEIFSFELAGGFVNSALGESNTSINSAISLTLKDLPDGPFATFLTNHDQNRVMSVMMGNIHKAKVAAAMLLTAPGTPFIYYGEEIGMEGKKPDEDIRLPMQWNDSLNAGFTTGTPWRSPGSTYPQTNVQHQTGDPTSLLSFYRTFISLRRQHSALQNGSLIAASTGNNGIYAILRNNNTESIIVIINLTKSPISEYNISIQGLPLKNGNYGLKSLFGEDSQTFINIKDQSISDFTPIDNLLPYAIYVYQINPN